MKLFGELQLAIGGDPANSKSWGFAHNLLSLLPTVGQPPSACADCKNGRAATIADPISPGTTMAIIAKLVYFSINFLNKIFYKKHISIYFKVFFIIYDFHTEDSSNICH